MTAGADRGDKVHGEEAIIQRFLAPLSHGFPGAYALQDDCAAITPTPGHDIVVKTDPVAEGVHFHADDTPEDIGWKALAVNVSDLAAKAARPVAYLMALSFPEAPDAEWLRRFADGLGAAQRVFGMHLIGGDTDRRQGPVSITITVFGEVPTGRMIQRAAARPGDHLFVSGELGSAALGLALRRDGAPALLPRWGLDPASPPSAGDWRDAVKAYLRPQPRLSLRRALHNHARAAMDLSDGLAKDLGRMCKASSCGAVVDLGRLPMLPIVARAIEAEPDRWQAAAASGDDYEILAAVPDTDADAFAAMAASDGVSVTHIGRCLEGDAVEFRDTNGQLVSFARSGWDHF